VFYDPTAENSVMGKPEEDSGFFGNIFQSVGNLFTSAKPTVRDVIKDLGQTGEVLKIDVTNPNLEPLMEDYNVEATPYIVVLKNDAVLYSGHEKPTLPSENSEEEDLSNIASAETVEKQKQKGLEHDLYSLIEDTEPTSIDSPNSASESIIGESEVKSEATLIKPKTMSYPKPAKVEPAQSPQSDPKSSQASGMTLKKHENATTSVISAPKEAALENIDQDWKTILQKEERIAEKIKGIYDEDKKLSETLEEAEDDIHESEELFYQAKNAIDKTLQESEQQMLQYESELDKLYNARLAAKKAREDLYHPYGNRIPTKDGYQKPTKSSQYKPVRKRKQGPPKSANFHDMLRSTDTSSTGISN